MITMLLNAANRKACGLLKESLPQWGRDWLQKNQLPNDLRVRPEKTIFTVTLFYPDQTFKIAVKPLNKDPEQIEKLISLHENLRQTNEFLSNRLPRFFGFSKETGCLGMDFIQGTRLVKLLKKELRWFGPKGICKDALDQTAQVLAHLHSHSAESLGLSPDPRRPETFRDDFETLLGKIPKEKCFSLGFNIQKFFEQLPKEFFHAKKDFCFPIDVQPKNILVQPSGTICLVDNDYTAGPPALSLAYFLVSLDRLGIFWPFRRTQEKISQWKKWVVEKYLDLANPETGRELVFYYPWSILWTLEFHRQRRPFFGTYLSWYYLGILRRFFRRLALKSPRDHFSIADLF